MSDYRLLITEVTNFGDLRCVAGWDLDREKMVRPEPHPGGFWSQDKAGPNGPFRVGQTVRLSGAKPNPATAYPHLTEDRIVKGQIDLENPLKEAKAKEILKAAAFDTLDDLFDGNLVVDGTKAYVAVGAECSSLGGLIVPSKDVTVESYHNYKGKERLRLRFSDPNYDLAPNLTSTKAYEIHAGGKLDELNARLAKSSQLILRIGLARAFPEVPDKCYMQVNGLAILP